jgi:hypothetical protein
MSAVETESKRVEELGVARNEPATAGQGKVGRFTYSTHTVDFAGVDWPLTYGEEIGSFHQNAKRQAR